MILYLLTPLLFLAFRFFLTDQNGRIWRPHGPTEPASLTVGARRQFFVDPYTRAVLGEGNGQSVRAFFVLSSHGTGMSPHQDPTAHRDARSPAANLAFLFIVVSGLFLWWPCVWTRPAIRPCRP